ncbi:MAG TPA: outer membrane protein assembly factor BamD [Gemmatimonadaceae bacterium]|nr:outer membrane protein assembly factor BamD [Gemmatimonadaceae bacterium]
MQLPSWPRTVRIASIALIFAAACSPAFKLSRYKTNDVLYTAAMREYRARHWDNSIQAFERLTLNLPARDSLLPRSYWYLATAHGRKEEHLLAAQGYARLNQTFPDDSLADDAMLAEANEYAKMWRKPALDAQYGQTALATYRSMIELYPDSPLAPQATAGISRMLEWLASKDYLTGVHYVRRKAPDSAILYFKDVIKNYPETTRAREAYLRLVEVYRSINYRDDARDACATLHQKYPSDREVRTICGPPPPATVAQPS